MELKELFGKTITRIYAVFGVEQEWLDTADCFLEIDEQFFIGFPFYFNQDVWVRELAANAEQLFQGNPPTIVIGRQISDFVWYEDDDYGGYFLLDDGSLITETRMSPQGTGEAGLNFFRNLEELAELKGSDMKMLSKQISGNR